ncbi:MAG: hypothetical protein ACI4OJ_03465 [Lachnospiraceae bacterium]
MSYTLVTNVHRVTKPSVKVFKAVMAAGAVLFLVMGVMFSQGFMLPCFLMAGLYFLYDYLSKRDYRYTLEDGKLLIEVIRGERTQKTAHELDLQNLIVVAPHDADAVAPYRRGAREGKLPKFDYTSYDDTVPYYTMIITEDGKKEKFLLDLSDEMLEAMYRKAPSKVIRR